MEIVFLSFSVSISKSELFALSQSYALLYNVLFNIKYNNNQSIT